MARKCDCGGRTFNAYQRTDWIVVVDDNGEVAETVDIIGADYPRGPFECRDCSKKFDYLEDVPEYDGD